jgi:uncharacterized membrane-anchored protein
MSCFRPRLSRLFVSAVMAVAAGVILAPPTGVAREGHRVNHETDIPVLSAPTRQGFDDIIVQMAPLRPAPGAVAAKAAPAPGVARETTPAPAVEAGKDSAAPKDAAKTEPATPQNARTDGPPELRTGEPAMPAAAAVAQAAKPAAQPSGSVAQHDLSQGIKDLDLRIGEAAMPAKVATADQSTQPAVSDAAPAAQGAKGLDLKVGEAAMPAKVATADQSAKRLEQVPAPSTPVERQTPATAVQTAKLPDLTIGEAVAPRQPAPFAAPIAAPSPPVAQPSPAPAAQAAKLPDLKIGEAAAPSVVVAATPSTPVAQPSPAPAAQAAKLPDLKIGEVAAPSVVVAAAPSTPVAQPSPAPAAQAAKLPDLKIGEAAAPSTPIAQETPAPAAQAAKAPDLKTAAPPVAAQAADPAPAAAPVAQVTVAQAPTNETLAYAALLAQGVRGPVEVRLADRATMWLPANRVYLDGEQARKLLGAGKKWDNATQGVVLPTTSRPDWMAYVSLVDDGYISDQDAKAMDPEAVLGTYKAKVAAENPARARQGLSPLDVTGWMEAPRYDAKHRLSSCLGATVLGSKSADDRIVNCSSFALGDQGALKIVVAGQEANYQRFRGESGALIDTIVYDKGKGYDDADLATVKTAPYGLIALMTGDTNFKKVTVAQPAAPAPAQKLGLIALLVVYALKFGKMLLFGVAAVFAFVRWMARKRKSDDKKPAKAEVAAEPIWRRAIQAARARLGSRGEPAQPVAASAGAAEPELAEARPKTGVGAALAAARAKLPSLPFPRKGSEPAAASNAAPQGEESPATSLARLASMMRKKAPEVPVQVDLSRLERRPSFGAATAAAVKRSELEVVRPLPGAAPMAAPKPIAAVPAPAPRAEPAPEPMPAPSPAPTLEPFALIEPGDEAAASIAISARESLREANG